MSFKNFLQNGPINEGLFSNLFGNGKKKPERPQTAVGKDKDAYRTHDDIDPADVPVFKPSFTVKKEDEEIEEGRSPKKSSSLPGSVKKGSTGYENRKLRKAILKPNTNDNNPRGYLSKADHYKDTHDIRSDHRLRRMMGEGKDPLVNRKIKKASRTSSKTGNFAKVDHYVKNNDERNIAYTTKNFKKKTVKEEGLSKQLRQKGYNGPKVGDDRHLTFTKKGNKNDQVLVDLPGKEWHAMKDGVVKKVGKLKESRGRITSSSKKDSGVNRKERKAIKAANIASRPFGDPTNFSKADYYADKSDARKMKKEEVSPLLKVKHLGTRLDEGRARLSKDSKMNDGKNRKVRKAQKQAADTNVNLGHNFLAKVSYQRKRQKARERNSPRMTQNTGSVN